MANYLKGIGDASRRINEILPSFDARINHFLVGHTNGILRGEYNEFTANTIDRGVIVRAGMMQALGFFGCCDTDTQINFIMPSTTNFVHLFAEIDLSVVPNRFEVKATAMSNSEAWTPRQDNLKTVPNGRYQFPLWMVRLTATAITLTDRRVFINKPANAVTAEDFTTVGGIATRFTGVDTSIASARTDLTASVNTRLPKLTQILGAHSYTINSVNVGAQTVNLISGTSIADGDMLIVNARCTNFGTFAFGGVMRVHSSHETRLSYTRGGHGMPFNCLDVFAINIRRISNTQISLGGDPRTRIRNDGAMSAGENRGVWTHDAAYTIDSIFKINL